MAKSSAMPIRHSVLEQRRLARAVLAQQAVDMPALQRQAQVLEKQVLPGAPKMKVADANHTAAVLVY